jgi:hypothetical protein
LGDRVCLDILAGSLRFNAHRTLIAPRYAVSIRDARPEKQHRTDTLKGRN